METNKKSTILDIPIHPSNKIGDRQKIQIFNNEVELIIGTDRNGKLKWMELSNLAYK